MTRTKTTADYILYTVDRDGVRHSNASQLCTPLLSIGARGGLSETNGTDETSKTNQENKTNDGVRAVKGCLRAAYWRDALLSCALSPHCSFRCSVHDCTALCPDDM